MHMTRIRESSLRRQREALHIYIMQALLQILINKLAGIAEKHKKVIFISLVFKILYIKCIYVYNHIDISKKL